MTRKLGPRTLVIATHNAGKLMEIRALLSPYGVACVSAGSLGLPEPEETGASFLANARLKAEAARDGTRLAAVGDDSGLVVPALGGQPGIHSARWAGPERDFAVAMARLDREVRAAGPDRAAHFISLIVLALPDGREVIFEGRVDGTLVWPPRGTGGFGYDAMFVPAVRVPTVRVPGGKDPATGRSFAEMPFAEKQGYSHRGIALRALVANLRQEVSAG